MLEGSVEQVSIIQKPPEIRLHQDQAHELPRQELYNRLQEPLQFQIAMGEQANTLRIEARFHALPKQHDPYHFHSTHACIRPHHMGQEHRIHLHGHWISSGPYLNLLHHYLLPNLWCWHEDMGGNQGGKNASISWNAPKDLQKYYLCSLFVPLHSRSLR